MDRRDQKTAFLCTLLSLFLYIGSGACTANKAGLTSQEAMTSRESTMKDASLYLENVSVSERTADPQSTEARQPKHEEAWSGDTKAVADNDATSQPDTAAPETSREPTPEMLAEPTREAAPDRPSLPLVTNCQVPKGAAADKIIHITNLVYGREDKAKQSLDITRPVGQGPFPLVVLIHGGSWRAGDKRSYHSVMRILAGQGYVTATLNYRLAKAPRNVFPAAVQDVRCALRWLRSKASTHRIDPSRVVAMGYSAGAHLAAMLGTASNVKGLDSPTCPTPQASVRVNGTIAHAGVYDLLLATVPFPKSPPDIVNFLGVDPKKDKAKAILASPMRHLDATDPPILFHHGTQDKTVPVAAARLFKISVEAAGIPHRYVEILGAEHAIPTLSRNKPFLTSTCTTLAFLKHILR